MSRPIKLISGNSHRGPGRKPGGELGVALEVAEIGAFADGENRVYIGGDVRDAVVAIVQPTCPPVNEHLMTLSLMADAVRAAGAAQVIAIVPYFGYARQETARTRRRSSLGASCRAIARCGRRLTTWLRSTCMLPRWKALSDAATLIQADELFLPLVRNWGLSDMVVISPDAGA